MAERKVHEVVIVGAARTAIGAFQGSLASLPAPRLGAVAIKAALERAGVTPEDVKSIGPDVLRHRLILTYEAEAQAVTADALIKKIFNAVPVP